MGSKMSAAAAGEPPEYELIKCVLVGDSGVGKTKLASAQASGVRYSLTQLVAAHVPTVWAIDRYATDKEVLKMSRFRVDDIPVSMRLWDTFGYHDKDRRFAYSRADVVLLCFSVVQPASLRHVTEVWYPEVRRCCPGVPILLVGCKTDLRYLYLDKDFQAMDKNPFFRPITEDDIISPEKGREVARTIRAYYYECEVLTRAGMAQVFENAVRAALLKRMNTRFWASGLKGVNRPQVQSPHRPPCPPPPAVVAAPSISSPRDLSLVELRARGEFCDMELVVGSGIGRGNTTALSPPAANVMSLVCDVKGYDNDRLQHSLQCHQVVLAASCPAVQEILLMARRALVSAEHGDCELDVIAMGTDSDDDCQSLLAQPSVAETSQMASGNNQRSVSPIILNHHVFRRVTVRKSNDRPSTDGDTTASVSSHVCIEVDEEFRLEEVTALLNFIYTGHLPPAQAVSSEPTEGLLTRLQTLAEALQMNELLAAIRGQRACRASCADDSSSTESVDAVIAAEYISRRTEAIEMNLAELSPFRDVVFHVDECYVPAHRVLLASKSEVLHAMFSNNFLEGSQAVINFPCTSEESFRCLCQALSGGSLPTNLHPAVCMELIVVANQLCLPEVVTLAEKACVATLTQYEYEKRDTVGFTLALLEPAQLHNAPQLAAWCLHHLRIHYLHMFRRHQTDMAELSPANKDYLVKHRWPPLWYLREADYYQKCQKTQQTEQDITGACVAPVTGVLAGTNLPRMVPSLPFAPVTLPTLPSITTGATTCGPGDGHGTVVSAIDTGVMRPYECHGSGAMTPPTLGSPAGTAKKVPRHRADERRLGCLCFSGRK